MPHGTVILPVVFADEVLDTPLSSLGLLLMGRGLYSRLGTLDAADILKHAC